jgi:hypothetical protein
LVDICPLVKLQYRDYFDFPLRLQAQGGTPHLLECRPDPARLLEIIYPAGFERFFEELGALAASDPPLEYEQFEQGRAELAAKYDLPIHSEWIPELKGKYNLKVLGE